MFGRNLWVRRAATTVAMAAFLAMSMGCPLLRFSGTAKVTTVFTTTSTPLKSALIKALDDEKANVDVADIESLTVTLDEIAFDTRDDDDTDEKAKEVVFTGPLDVNLLDLTQVSEAISSAEVQAGVYTKIRLAISNPRLVLKSDPGTTITDVKLTANGHLFIGGVFTLPTDSESLLILDFGGIHLVQTGNGGYVLTPQLTADLTIQDAAVVSSGIVADLDTEADTFTLLIADGSLAVSYTGASIFLETDTDTATGTEADLADGQSVDIEGTLQVDGSVEVSAVRIIAAAP